MQVSRRLEEQSEQFVCPVHHAQSSKKCFQNKSLGSWEERMEISPPQWGTASGLYKTANWAEQLIFKSIKDFWMKKQGNNTGWQRDGTFSAYVISELIARTPCPFGEPTLQKRRLEFARGLGGERLKQENTAVQWRQKTLNLFTFIQEVKKLLDYSLHTFTVRKRFNKNNA